MADRKIMKTKEAIDDGLKKVNGGAEVITKTQIARFYNCGQITQRVRDIVRDLGHDGRYYLRTEVRDEIYRRME